MDVLTLFCDVCKRVGEVDVIHLDAEATCRTCGASQVELVRTIFLPDSVGAGAVVRQRALEEPSGWRRRLGSARLSAYLPAWAATPQRSVGMQPQPSPARIGTGGPAGRRRGARRRAFASA